eukprot:gene15264-biopygen2840
MDRSPWSSLEVFLPSQHLPANLNELVEHCATLLEDKLDKVVPTVIICLDAPPKECLTRVQKRGHAEEQEVTTEYLQHPPQEQQPAISHDSNNIKPPPMPLADVSTTTDSSRQVPVLYQSGPGKFHKSQQLKTQYQLHHGDSPDDVHRLNNLPVLEILTTLDQQASDVQSLQKQITYLTLNNPSTTSSIEQHQFEPDASGPETHQINLLHDLDPHSPTPKRQRPVPSNNRQSPEVDPTLPCEICQDPDDWENMLLCEDCLRGFHTYCIGLAQIPEGDWRCDACASNDKRVPVTLSGKSTHPKASTSPTPSKRSDNSDSLYTRKEETDDSEDFEEEDAEGMESSAKDIWDDAPVIYYIKTGTHNSARLPVNSVLKKKEIKRIEKRAANYQWDNSSSTLYKKPAGRFQSLRPCPPVGDRHNIITELHSELGHVGSARLTTIINTRYWWPGISKQAKAVVKACPDCIRNRALFRQEVPLQPIPLPDGLFERIHLDSAGPYPRSRSGNIHLYLAVCATSKYPMAIAAPKLSAADFTAFFMLHVVAQHGVPTVVIHDSGPEFGEPWSTCLRELGVQQRRSSAYHPNTNGQAESMVKQILHSLQRMINETGSPETWDERLPMALLGLRTAPNASTKHSPAYVVYGRHLCLPAQRRRTANTLATEDDTQSKESPAPTAAVTTAAAAAAAAATAAAAAAVPNAPKAAINQTPWQQQPTPRPKRQLAILKPTAKKPAPEPAKGSHGRPPSSLIIISSKDTLEEGTKQLMQHREGQKSTLRRQLEANVKASQEKMKRDHSRRRHSTMPSTVMPPGSLVLMQSPPSSKLSKGVEGPYLLVRYNDGNSSAAGTSAAAAASDSHQPETRALLEDGSSKRWWVAVTR